MKPSDALVVSRLQRNTVVALVALLSTMVSYRYGSGNQLEQLPIILNRIDPGFLSNDIFILSAAEFGPRYYFVELLGWLGAYVPLHWLYLVLTYLTDLALICTTIWAARRILGCDQIAALVSGVLVLGVSSFHLGDATQIRYEIFQPASLALPGALFAVSLGLLGRPFSAVGVAIAASIAHPIYGVHAALLALGTAFISLISVSKQSWLSVALRTVLAGVIFAGALFWLWWLPFQQVNAGFSLSSEKLFDILGRFRAPHHYLPSQFRTADYVTTVAFTLATAIAYEKWRRSQSADSYRDVVLVPLLGVAVGCTAGWFFAEVWPLGLILTVQPFRLLSILKWIGLMLIGWYCARLWRAPGVQGKISAACSCLSGGAAHSLVTLVILLMERLFSGRLSSKILIAGAVLSTGALWAVAGSAGETIYLAASFCLLIAVIDRSDKYSLVYAVVPTVAFVLIALNVIAERPVSVRPLIPVISFSDLESPQADIARAASRLSPESSMFVVPPDLGEIRTVGGRAAVTDFKSVPFSHSAMAEWFDRIETVYGRTDLGGFPALGELDRRYRTITDEHLHMISDTYDADFAILYKTTETKMPVAFENDHYKIVRITPRAY